MTPFFMVNYAPVGVLKPQRYIALTNRIELILSFLNKIGKGNVEDYMDLRQGSIYRFWKVPINE